MFLKKQGMLRGRSTSQRTRNKSVNPTIRSVTVHAKARPAPARLAGHADRYACVLEKNEEN